MTTNLTEYLDAAATRTPDKLAFSDGTESVTFAELRTIAAEVGTYIVQTVRQTRQPIAVITRHNVADIAAFIGTMYAGCFYVPLDGDATSEFIQTRLETVDPALVIDARTLAELPRISSDGITLTKIRKSMTDLDPAYAVFTSGSTGIPKCAITTHRAAIDLIEWHTATFSHSAVTVYGNQTPFYFIAAVKEIYLTLRNIATTHILPKSLFATPVELLKKLDALKIDTIMWATAAIKLIAVTGALSAYTPQHLKNVFFSGENIQGKQLNVWRNAMPDVSYVNLYGLTETTTNIAYYIVGRKLRDDENVPIGFPRKNVRIDLLNCGETAAAGEVGEIVVCGSCVSLGYYLNETQTSRMFVQNPLNRRYREIVCRTGDIARTNEYGELVCVSRADSQVKHMGVRVELGEVETVAACSDGIFSPCCLYDFDKSKIVLFYQGELSEVETRKILLGRLPKYMLPNIIVRLTQMPFGPNGKIDRAYLKQKIKEL